MKSITKKVLDTVRPYKGTPILAVTGDYNSRFINAVICANDVPVTIEKNNAVTVTFELEDKTSRTFSGTVNDDGTVTVPIVSWATDQAGDVWAWITVGEAETAISTTRILIIVQERPNVGGEVTEDDPEYDDYLSILARLSDHDTRLSDAEKNVEKALQISSRNDKRIANFEARINPSLLLVDDSAAYAKSVPETALPYAEIVKVGGMTHKVNVGTEESPEFVLRSASVTQLSSVGSNLLPMCPETSSEVIKFNPQSDGSYTINGEKESTSSYNIRAKFPKPLPAGTYTVTLNNPYVIGDGTLRGSLRVWFQTSDGNYTGAATAYVKNRSLTFTSDLPLIEVAIRIGEEIKSLNNFVIRPKLEMGSTATPFTTYRREVFPIPEEVRALSGYGEGNPDDPNEYNAVIWRDDGSCVYSHKGDIVDGVWIPLESEEIIDISDLLPADNYIGVEENGTIFAENKHSYDVPTTIEFQLREVQS